MSLVTVIAPPDGRTTGTRVVLEDGSELEGVTKIVLTAGLNDLWRAEIHCYAKVGPIRAEAKVCKVPPKPPLERMVIEGRGAPRCPSCGSSMMRKRWLFFGARLGCIHPECENYGGAPTINPGPM